MHDRANEIVDTANSLVGVRYRNQGRSRVGLDCAGLVIYVAKLCGISNFDTTSYSTRPDAHEFTMAMVRAKCTQIPYTKLRHGDMLRLNSEGWPVHIGIYEVDENQREWYIHAYLPHKKVSRDPVTLEVRAKISSTWRFPEVCQTY